MSTCRPLLLLSILTATFGTLCSVRAEPILLPDQTLVHAPESWATGFGSAMDGDGSFLVVAGPDEHAYFVYSDATGWTPALDYSVGAGPVTMSGQLVAKKSLPSNNVQVTLFDGNSATHGGFSNGITFADALAVHPDRLVIGVPAPNGNPGFVWIFHHEPDGTWLQEEVLHGTDFSERYGAAVALDASGEVLWIGVPGDGSASATGRVERWVFSGGVWVPFGSVEDPLQDPGNRFGAALAVDGERLAVGAPLEDGLFPFREDAGAIFLFHSGYLGALTLEGSFTGAESSDRLGTSVDIRGRTAIAGSPGRDLATPEGLLLEAGEAEVYRRNPDASWTVVAQLAHDAPDAQDAFGTSVAVVGPTVLAGAPGATGINGHPDGGAVFAYRFPTLFADGFESGDTSVWSSTEP